MKCKHLPLNPQSTCDDWYHACGARIYWNGEQYEVHKQDSLTTDIAWACVIALALAVVSVARHW